jgi:acyl-CoA synthetase (NDP forming)
MRAALADAGLEVDGFLVQRMAAPGPELLVGAVGDPRFGPLVAVGAGGTAAELMRDVQVRLAPVGARTAAEMLSGLRSHPLLVGYRGGPAADVAAVEALIARVSALVDAHPEVAELDLTPVVVSAAGAVALDARVRVQQPPPRRPWPSAD